MCTHACACCGVRALKTLFLSPSLTLGNLSHVRFLQDDPDVFCMADLVAANAGELLSAVKQIWDLMATHFDTCQVLARTVHFLWICVCVCVLCVCACGRAHVFSRSGV